MDVVRLQEVVAKATEATTTDEVARILIEEGTGVLGAAMGGLWRLEGDHLVLVHFAGAQQPAGRFQRLALDADAPLAVCVREKQAIWLADAADYARRFPDSDARIDSHVGCACLPLLVAGKPIGGAAFAFDGTRVFTEQEQASLMLIARQCASVLERLRLAAAAQQVAGRMSSLQAIASRLAAARGLDAIVRVVIEDSIGALGASTAAVWRIEGNEAVLVAQLGSPRAVVEAVSRIGLDETGALATALRTRTAQFVSSREAAAAEHQYKAERWAVIEAVAFVPLVAGTRLLGVIGLGFAERRVFDTSQRELFDLFAGHAAQAIARDRDDAAQRLLAEASADLASSLDAAIVLERVGKLTVETFADWCFVDLVRDGAIERVVVAHADPADAALAEQLRGLRAPATTGVLRVVASLEPLLVPRLAGSAYLENVVEPRRRALIEALGVRSVLCVPMSVGGRAIGTITWITRGRELDEGDVLVAAQIARAAAAALENARLYEAEAAAARRLGKLYELSVALSSARTPEDVASATARLGGDATGASSCMIWIRDSDGVLRMRGSSAPPAWTAEWMELTTDPALPANRVIANGEPVWVESPREYAHEAAVVFERVQQAGRVQPFAALPLVVGGVRAGVIVWSWTTEHRFAPAERTFLHAIARSCEQAIERAQLYATEAGARAAAESASRAKDEFLAMLGHELRNPLAPIVTALDLLRMRNIAEGMRERSVIERQVAHLTRLVDDLLDISRITRGKIELRRTTEELLRAVEPAIDAVGPLLVQQRHQLSVDVPASGLRVDGDTSRLSQVVRNLLTNAAKFTPAGGMLSIAARAVDDVVELTVRDNGRGIAPSLLPYVFEPFVQGSQGAERAGGGLGLGLAIVRSLVAAHGGTVAVHSDGENRGTRVVVRLPRASAAASEHGASGPTTTSRSLRVLVVDDNVDAAALLADLLRLLGHEPMIAHDGPAALAVVEREQPQLAILDIGLPGMDGYELARRLRERPDFAGVPVVALTGYGQASDRERTREAGFVEHLVKPIDLKRLTDVVGRYAQA